ncbi:uncharacterized protein LOC143035291 [Oratosquilla oratoria]|uniref:uncharacterized protein LOC143035291 n=1 Tax=Oratosquilla oratoria TaxID=337810 RepID=UPI003F75BC01
MPLLGVMAEKVTFEQLCVRPQKGYVLEEKAMLKFSSPNSFDDVVFKITSKCDTGKVLLSSHQGALAKFTVDIVPVYGDTTKKAKTSSRGKRLDQEDSSPIEESVVHAWEVCKSKGFHGLHVITCLEPSSMPDNGCRTNYSLSQFVNSVIHSIEAYYMFQRPDSRFYPDTVHLWNPADATVSEARSYCVVLVWKFEGDPEDFAPKSPKFASMNLGRPDEKLQQSPVLISKESYCYPESNLKSSPKKRLATDDISHGSEKTQRTRRSGSHTEIPIQQQIEDPEITFNFKSQVDSTLANRDTERAVSNIAVDEIKFGFEKSTPKTPGRKSTARKSLLPDWPTEEKEGVIEFFDCMNPASTETTRIALTCKYASMIYDRELPSKLLYQWIQKKGRQVYTSGGNFSLPEGKRKETAVSLFKELKDIHSEQSRISFTCKYMHSQYGFNLTSKDLYTWLNEKEKKTPKRK